MKLILNRRYISYCAALVILLGLNFLAALQEQKGSPSTPKMGTLREKIDTINTCLPFYELLDIHGKAVDKRYEEHNGSISLIAAYAFPDYSVITFETKNLKGQKAYCWYLDEGKHLVGPPVETVVRPRYMAYCCRRHGAHYMSISSNLPITVNDHVPIIDRTQDAPKYRLSHCLSPLYGNGPKWLLFAEFIEHYKLMGVEYFYVYVKDIDDYSRRVLYDYVRTGEIETIFLRTNDRPGADYQFAAIHDCLHRSRHHSRYVIFGDLDERIVLSGTATLSDYVTKVMTLHSNVRSIRFRPRYVLYSQSFPSQYQGDATLNKYLPTLVYHNTTPAHPELGIKCVVDPTAVMTMAIHKPIMFFSNYETYNAPVADGFIR
ncbi:hypothetical protein Q1695_005858 [Nippostrongylus brasiliensis]|nr:hypothetical protein Q1695_005858 [Nippostrongylus brasiliensis]